MGLSAITFDGFISKYLESRKRKDLALSMPIEEVSYEPTAHEKFRIGANLALECQLVFEVTGKIDRSGAIVYKFLEKLGVCEMDNEDKAGILEQARIEVTQKLISEKQTCLDRFKRLDFDRMLDGKKPIDEKVKAHARCIALKTFFQSLEIEEQDLKALINSKKPKF